MSTAVAVAEIDNQFKNYHSYSKCIHLNAFVIESRYQLCSFKFPIVLCELCFVLHFHSFIVPLAVLFVDLVHSILLFALRLSRRSCNQVVSDCF